MYVPREGIGYLGILPDGTLKVDLKRFDATAIEGRIWTPKPFTRFDTAFAVDANFSMPLGAAAAAAAKPPSIIVTGNDSPPAKAYADYYRTSFSGEMAKIRPFIASARLQEMDKGSPEQQKMWLDMLKGQPHEIKITKANATGKNATLLVEGVNETATRTTGEITLALENGVWKVVKENWKSTSK